MRQRLTWTPDGLPIEPLPADEVDADGQVLRGGIAFFTWLCEVVLAAAEQGRALYIPAGARGNPVAMVWIDGRPFWQATSCDLNVTPEPGPAGIPAKLIADVKHPSRRYYFKDAA